MSENLHPSHPLESFQISEESDNNGNPRHAVSQRLARQETGKLSALCLALFVAGMTDAATGALLPYIRTSYNIGLLFVALVYLANFCGWILAAFTNVYLTARAGISGVLTTSAGVLIVALCLMFWRPPYGLFVASYFFLGLGIAYLDAQANTFTASLDNAHRWLGVLHAIYGVGAFVSPLAATALVSNIGEADWHYYYAILLGVAAINFACILWAFRDGLFRRSGANTHGDDSNDLAAITTTVQTSNSDASRQLKKALSSKAVWILSVFFFFYVGAEVTAGGWVVEFLVSVRHGKPSKVGYVASGFWGGLALGRVVLADVTHKLGDHRMIFVYLIVGLAMELIFWFVPNIIADAIVISFFGFIIAPFFPVGISILTRLVPSDLHVASVGFSSTFGQAGSAAFPFLTGAIASRKGVIVLQPIMVSLLAGMAILWALVPRIPKRSE